MKKITQKTTLCKCLDSETWGFRPIVPKNVCFLQTRGLRGAHPMSTWCHYAFTHHCKSSINYTSPPLARGGGQEDCWISIVDGEATEWCPNPHPYSIVNQYAISHSIQSGHLNLLSKMNRYAPPIMAPHYTNTLYITLNAFTIMCCEHQFFSYDTQQKKSCCFVVIRWL